jgi:hypothetical protein
MEKKNLTIEVPPDIVIAHSYKNTTWRTASLTQDHAGPTPTFFYLIPILRRFRIIRCNRQATLHSALFNYAPFVIGGTNKNKQLNIIKLTHWH